MSHLINLRITDSFLISWGAHQAKGSSCRHCMHKNINRFLGRGHPKHMLKGASNKHLREEADTVDLQVGKQVW